MVLALRTLDCSLDTGFQRRIRNLPWITPGVLANPSGIGTVEHLLIVVLFDRQSLDSATRHSRSLVQQVLRRPRWVAVAAHP
jgi:hypothetical protein